MKMMAIKLPGLRRLAFLTASALLLFTFSAAAYGQETVKIRNTSRQIRPGLYECTIYIEASESLLKTIDDVTYKLPPGFPKRMKEVKARGDKNYPFGWTFTTSEEVAVNVTIDYKNKSKHAYLSHKLKF